MNHTLTTLLAGAVLLAMLAGCASTSAGVDANGGSSRGTSGMATLNTGVKF